MRVISDARARSLWRTCLASALRTLLACAIVGGVTLYGPASLQRRLAFPAFSYVTAVLIITDATLGDAWRGCWLALYATVQSVGPAILSLWLIGPPRLSSGTTALAAAVAAFVVAAPETTHVTAKRIALGQVMLVYVIGYIEKERIEPVMHPLHVAASTAVGALACPLALLLPFPNMATFQIKEKCKAYMENASNRFELFVKAFLAADDASALASVSQAKYLSLAGATLLQDIKLYQDRVLWERVPFKSSRAYHLRPDDRLQEGVEMPLRGMHMALASTISTSFPITSVHHAGEDHKDEGLPMIDGHRLAERIRLLITKQFSGSTVPESCNSSSEDEAKVTAFFDSLVNRIPTNSPQHLPSIFFLFCMKLLYSKLTPQQMGVQNSYSTESIRSKESATACFDNNSNKQKNHDRGLPFQRIWTKLGLKVSTETLISAFRCSISLGLAVLFGLLYSRENGYWAGLPIAVSFSASREATFKVANVKAQGTVLGTVYGVMGCFLFGRFLPLRFMSMLPWFVFSSFLRKSKMYGQAGGVSAVIGAVLILGRKNFGPPSEFAIARIVETFIGLTCSILVDLCVQPTRASSLAKRQLHSCFGALKECITSLGVALDNDGHCREESHLIETQKRLRMSVVQLRKHVEEAGVEPNFWFLPFHGDSYAKLLGSLTRMVDLLHFSGHVLGFLEQESTRRLVGAGGCSLKESLSKIQGDLELFKDLTGSSIKCFQEITSITSLSALEEALRDRNNTAVRDDDLELGKEASKSDSQGPHLEEGEIEKMVESYIQDSQEVVERITGTCDHSGIGGEEKEMTKSEMAMRLGALGYCMSDTMRESREMEKTIKELLQWENPSNPIDLHDILCKIQALQS